MMLPVQALPIARTVSAAPPGGGIGSVIPSGLGCDLCCQMGGGEKCRRDFPGCICQ